MHQVTGGIGSKRHSTRLGSLGRLIKRSVTGSGTLFANITSLGLYIMILMGTIDIIGAKLFKAPLPATLEVTQSMMLVITFGGFAFVQHQKRNIKVDLLTRHLSPRFQNISELAGNLFGFVLFALLTWRSALFFWESFEIREYEAGLIPFPIYPTKFIMLLGAGLVTIQLLVDAFQAARRLCGKEATPKQI